MPEYNTKQREVLLKFFTDNADEHFTAAEIELALGVVAGECDISCGDADRCGPVFYSVVADDLDLGLGCRGGEKCMVGVFEKFLFRHFYDLRIIYCIHYIIF